MKKLLLAIVLYSAISSFAQDTNTSPPNFYDSFTSYFTKFNTNLAPTFATDRVNIWLGADTINSSTTEASFGISVYIAKPWFVESVTRNGAIAGTVVTEQLGAGYSFVYVDTKVSSYVDIGYKFDNNKPYTELGIDIRKALTLNTYAGTRVALPIYWTQRQNITPTISIFTGFKF